MGRKRIVKGKSRKQQAQQEATLLSFESNKNYALLSTDEIKIDFQDIFGHKECKNELRNLISFLENPEKYNNFGVRPHTRYLITGNLGVGKKTIICALAKTTGLPIIIVEPTFFYNIEAALENEVDNLFTEVENMISEGRNCILLFKEFQWFLSQESKFKMPCIEKLLGYFKLFPEVIMFATISSASIEVPQVLLETPGFTKTVALEVPDINIRKEIFAFFLQNIPVSEKLDIHKLALDTHQMTVSDIKKLIQDTKLMTLKKQAEVIEYEHFSEALSESEFGHQNQALSEEERLCTARHESGHVIAGYFSDPEGYKISKVDVTPRSIYAGITITNVNEDKLTFFKDDIKKRIIHCLGGMAAEEFYYNSTSIGVSADLMDATSSAVSYVKYFGMSKMLGPVCLDEAILNSPILHDEADREIQQLLKELYNKTFKIIIKHSDKLEKLSQALMEKEVLFREEILEILKS